MSEACARAGRSPAEVRLVAVSKTFPAEVVRELMACGHDLFGENRVQEALDKIAEVGPGAIWHMVGHLQRNKARHAVGAFELIHSVDSVALAREIDRRAAERGIVQPILLQLNLGAEQSKSGAGAGEVEALARAAAALPALELRGLMAIPPPGPSAAAARGWFAKLRELRDGCARQLGRPLPELSMGMTDDFEVAIEEGATLIRVGRALFGERLVE
jgi:pyridoxal phosphate enzyme (YggS family)